MNKSVEYAVYTVGGLALFCSAFLGFAKMQGVPMHTLPLLGGLFVAPEEGAAQESPDAAAAETAPAMETAQTEQPARATSELLERPTRPSRELRAGLNVLAAFSIEAPYSANELQELVARLLELENDLQRRLASIEEREHVVTERMEDVDAQMQVLEAMRADIERQRGELESVRAQALGSDDPDATASAELSKLFVEGEPASLTSRLLSFQPAQAAQILRHLSDTRAAELLNALEPAKWQEYARAYSQAAPVGD